jgi:hypothetical protein
VALALNELTKKTKTLLPLVCARVPTPAGNGFESENQVAWKLPFGMSASLRSNPLAQSELVFHVFLWDARVALALNELAEETKALFPLFCKHVPRPTGKCFETVFSVGTNSP